MSRLVERAGVGRFGFPLVATLVAATLMIILVTSGGGLLGWWREFRDEQAVVSALADKDSETAVSQVLCDLQVKRGDEFAINAVCRAVENVDPKVRANGLKTIVTILSRGFSPALVLRTNRNAREACLAALLQTATTDQDSSIRHQALGYLANPSDPRLLRDAAPILVKFLDHQDRKIQKLAYETLLQPRAVKFEGWTGHITLAIRGYEIREHGLIAGTATVESFRGHKQDASELPDDLSDAPTCVGWDGGWQVYRYSVMDNSWRTWTSPQAPLPRRHVFSVVGKRKVAIVDPDQRFSGWIFDSQSAEWSPIPKFSIPSRTGAVDPRLVTFVEHELVVWGFRLGSCHGAIFDTESRTWRPMSEAPASVGGPHLVSVGKLLIWGGMFPNHLQDGAIYDLAQDKWAILPGAPLIFDAGRGCWTVWRDKFVVVGGYDNCSVAMFDLKTSAWESLEDVPFDLGRVSAWAVRGDQLFVWSSAMKTPTFDGHVYNFITREWTSLPPAPIGPRTGAFAKAIGSKIVVWSGSGPKRGCLYEGAIYDVESKVWKKLPELPGHIPPELRAE